MALVIGKPSGGTLVQEEMIDRVRRICKSDERVVAAWMYGSFAWGEGDAYSDIEFLIYLKDDVHASFDPLPWLSRIAPVALTFVNEHGIHEVIFENLVRGEFHFDAASDMAQIRAEKEMAAFPPAEAMLICDRTGELMEHLRYISGPGPDRMTAETAQHLWHSLLNWILFGANVLGRGERARALELLWFVQRHLLSMARLVEGSTAHWFPPVRYLEHDVSSASYQRYIACTASLRGDELEQAYANAWAWSKELARALVDRFELNLHERLIDRLDHRFTTP